MFFLELSNHPGLRPPLQWRGTGDVPSRAKVPLCGGVGEARGGYCGHCAPPPDGLTTATPRPEPPTRHVARGPVGGGHSGGCVPRIIPLHTPVQIHTCRWRLYRTHPLGHTLCTNHLGWTRYNLWLCRRTYNPMGMNCSQCPCIPRPLQYNPTGTKWTVRRQLHQPAQLPEPTQLFFSSSPPLVRK